MKEGGYVKRQFFFWLSVFLLAYCALADEVPIRDFLESQSAVVYPADEYKAMTGTEVFSETPAVKLCALVPADGANAIVWYDGENGFICLDQDKRLPESASSMGRVFAEVCENYGFDLYMMSVDGQRIVYAPRKTAIARYQRQTGNKADVVCKSKYEFTDMIPLEDVEAEPEPEPGCDYVLNRGTKKFHYPDCSSVKDMKAKNRIDFHGTREAVINMGYVPCKRCNP